MWNEWSPAAFARAAAEKRPMLLSLVTAWSDECAMMDDETYSRPEIASLIEERFVPVRVDTDRRPDINERYNLGGWPTTAFLTARGALITGGTFVPLERMPGVLMQVATALEDGRWTTEDGSVADDGHVSHRSGAPPEDTALIESIFATF